MPSITVKNIPDHAYEILKQAATTHHRSINSEIICLIEKATLSKPFLPEQHLALAKRSREKTKKFLLTNDILQGTNEDKPIESDPIATIVTYGDNTSVVEVTHISTHGVRLLTHNKELFMSYDDFPWFKNQTVTSIINVEESSHGHFYWPDIDVDLTEEIIENPKRFPLKAKSADQ